MQPRDRADAKATGPDRERSWIGLVDLSAVARRIVKTSVPAKRNPVPRLFATAQRLLGINGADADVPMRLIGLEVLKPDFDRRSSCESRRQADLSEGRRGEAACYNDRDRKLDVFHRSNNVLH